MQKYTPTLLSEETLMTTLIPGVLVGVSNRRREDASIKYSNVRVRRSAQGCDRTLEVVTSVDVTDSKNGDAPTCTHYDDVWLASIPRMNKDGVFCIDGFTYYTVMKQRLLPNVPRCYRQLDKESGRGKCEVRSENYVTLDSVLLRLTCKGGASGRITLTPKMRDPKPVDAMSYMRYLLATPDWQEAVLLTLRLLRCSDTVSAIVCKAMEFVTDVAHNDRILFPSTVNPRNNVPYTVVIGRFEVSASYVLLFQMLQKFLQVECNERDSDDVDDFSYKVLDSYCNVMGKLFRKHVADCRGKAFSTGSVERPKLQREFVEGITNNTWEITEAHNKDLQLSRLMETNSALSLRNNMKEVITSAGSHITDNANKEKYGARNIHHTQRGYMCMVRTADDINAGLKSYLASDCIVTHSCKIRGLNGDDDNRELRVMYFEHAEKHSLEADYTLDVDTLRDDIVLWTHNHVAVLVAIRSTAEALLDHIKKDVDPTLSWSMHDNVLESRCYYGRMMCSVLTDKYGVTYMDTREAARMERHLLKRPSDFSDLCFEVPFMNHMPVARTMLATKIVQKSIPAVVYDESSSAYVYLTATQRPLVRTTKSCEDLYATNVVVCYTTCNGFGVEDGIIVNRAAVERGLFSTFQKTTIMWTRDINDNTKVTKCDVYVTKNSPIKQGTILAAVHCLSADGEASAVELRHNKPYVCRVSDVLLKYRVDNMQGASSINNLLSIAIEVVRLKRFSRGDKLSSRYGQKAVAVSVMNDVDMPTIVAGNPCFASIDMIVNPLSIMSRSTPSQEMSSQLAMMVLDNRSYEAVEEPFKLLYVRTTAAHNLQEGAAVTDVVESLKGGIHEVLLADGVTGVEREGVATIGIESYMVLNHIADEKAKYRGHASRDSVTGVPVVREGETCVRYNWQEVGALLHSKSDELVTSLYAESGIVGNYPYCMECDRMVDCDRSNRCVYCATVIGESINVSRPINVASSITSMLGVELVVHGDTKTR
jgi:DNA-directed RNA polymerase beta subunit